MAPSENAARTADPRDERPAVSLLVPTLGRPILTQTLESVASVDGFDRMEVLVIGKIATPSVLEKVRALAAQHPQIRQIEVSFPTGDLSRKKNLGVQESRAELVAVIDDDLKIPPEWMAEITAPFEDPQVGMVSGPSLVPDDIGTMGRLSGVALSSKASGYVSERYRQGDQGVHTVRWSQVIGCNMAFRRSLMEEIGGFNPDIIPGEDLLAAAHIEKKGYRLVSNPKAYVWHYPRQTLKLFCRQIYRFGAARIRMIRAGAQFEPTTILPALAVLCLAVVGVASILFRPVLPALALGTLGYVLFALWVTLENLWRTRRAIDLLLFFLIPVMHLCYGVAEWVELLRPSKDMTEKVYEEDGS